MTETIHCCRAHRKQLFPALLCDLEVLMPFQRFKERGEKGNEAFWRRCGWRRSRPGTARAGRLIRIAEDGDAELGVAPLVYG